MSIYTLQYNHITAAEKTQARHPRPRRRLYCHTGGGTPETMEKALIRMLQALSRAALGTGFPFLMTTLGAAVVFFFAEAPRPQFQKNMLGFAAGVMTAASVWSLLLPAIDRRRTLDFPAGSRRRWGFCAAWCSLAALDAALPRLRRGRDEDPSRRQSTLLMAAITLHNVPEGMAVGLAFALAEAGEGHGRCRRTGHGNWNPEFPGGRGYLSGRCGRRGIPGGGLLRWERSPARWSPRRESWQRWRRPECGR